MPDAFYFTIGKILHKLNDEGFQAATRWAQGLAQRRGCLALSVTSIDLNVAFNERRHDHRGFANNAVKSNL